MQTLRELRRSKHLSAEDLGKLFNVAESTVYMWERGERTPPLAKAKKIADYFGCRIEDIFFGAYCTTGATNVVASPQR